jgi:hypothetical protein
MTLAGIRLSELIISFVGRGRPTEAFRRTLQSLPEDEAPGEVAGWVGVAATGYDDGKSFYSNYGMGKSDVSAPGGSTRDYFNSFFGKGIVDALKAVTSKK